MKQLQGRVRDYAWGSFQAIPEFFGYPPADHPLAELWLGTHPAASSYITEDPQALALASINPEPDDLGDSGDSGRQSLRDYLSTGSEWLLGPEVQRQFGQELPYLLKLIAPERPLSLQVHPSAVQAELGYRRENAQGISLNSPRRNYQDKNHKPELVYALERFEALAGFRSPRRIREVLEGLDTEITQKMLKLLVELPAGTGVGAVFKYLLDEESRPSPEQIAEVVAACAARNPAESPSRRADAIVQLLAKYYPEDPGVVVSLLLNPVTLQPGEALYIPIGMVHAYLRGMGVEIMANSDNVLRAGLTEKHVDVYELLQVVDMLAAPPIRIAPEQISPVQATYYAPVRDFELSVITVEENQGVQRLRNTGPRIIFCLAGEITLCTAAERRVLKKGQAVFLGLQDGAIDIFGSGKAVQADVP